MYASCMTLSGGRTEQHAIIGSRLEYAIIGSQLEYIDIRSVY